MHSLPQASIRSQVPIVLRHRLAATFITFDGLVDGKEHFALRLGAVPEREALLRIHSECITGDVFGSSRCDCGAQLNEALERIALEGGYLIYMRQEGRGIGLYSKLDAYLLQDGGLDTFEANRALSLPEDARSYEAAAQMIRALGLGAARLLTNNRRKRQALADLGIAIAAQVPTGVYHCPHNIDYLRTKVEKHGHTIRLPEPG